jgi:hypothetical protein
MDELINIHIARKSNDREISTPPMEGVFTPPSPLTTPSLTKATTPLLRGVGVVFLPTTRDVAKKNFQARF